MIAASGSMVSVGQVSGMYIITLGSGSADLFWRAGVKRFLEVTSVDAIAASKSSSESLKMTETLVSMFMCTENMVKVASGNGNGIQKYAYAPVSPKGVAVYTQSSTLPDFNKVRSKFARIGSNVAATSLYAQVREEIADSSDPYYSHFSIKFVDGICGSIKIPLGLKASSGSTRSEKAAYYSSFHTAQAVMVYLKTLGDKTQAFNAQLRTKAGADIINAYQKPEVSRYAKYLDDTTKHKAYINDIFQASVNLSQCISNTVNNAYTGDLSRAPKGGSARCGTDTTGLSDVNSSNGSTGLLDALTEGGWIYAPQMFSTLNGLMQVASSNATIGIDMLAVPELPVREAFCPEVTSGWSQIKSYFTGSDDTDNLVDHHRACFPYFFASSTPKYVWNQMRKRGMEHELIPAWEDARTLTNWSTALSIASGSDGQASTTSSGVGGNEIIGTAANMLARAMGVGSFGGNMALNLASPTSDGIDYSNGPFDVSGATNALGMLAALGETLKVIWLFLLTAMTALDVIGKAFQAGLTGNLLAILGIPAIVAAKVLMPLVLAAVSGAFFLSNVLPILPMVAFALLL